MSAFLNASSAGITAKKMIDWIMKKDPNMRRGIQTALSSGFTYEKILDFFKKNQNYEKLRSNLSEQYNLDFNANPAVQAQTIRQQNLGQDMGTSLQNFTKQGIKTGIPLAIGGLLAKTALPAIIPQIGNGEQKPQPQLPTPQQPPVNIHQEILSQDIKDQQPKLISTPKEYFEKQGILGAVDASLQRGNNPEQVATELGIKRSGKASIDPELLKNIEAYAQEKQIPPQEHQSIHPSGEELDISKEETQRPIEKGSLVATPSGIGEIESISGDNVLVNEDGKLKQVKANKLIESPVSQEDLAQLYDDLISGIEKSTGKQVSRNVEWAGYDPKVNELAYKPHDSDKFYVYDDISEEDAKLLTSLMTKRKSTGENFIGAWETGTESPIGAAMYQLIKRLQGERGGKGNEYWGRYETIYDALEPAKLARKEIYAKRKKEQRKKRKT